MMLVYAGLAVFPALRTSTTEPEAVAIWKVWIASFGVAWILGLFRAWRILADSSPREAMVEAVLLAVVAAVAAVALTAAAYVLRGHGSSLIAKPKT